MDTDDFYFLGSLGAQHLRTLLVLLFLYPKWQLVIFSDDISTEFGLSDSWLPWLYSEDNRNTYVLQW